MVWGKGAPLQARAEASLPLRYQPQDSIMDRHPLFMASQARLAVARQLWGGA